MSHPYSGRDDHTLGDITLDETYNVREAVDFLTEKLGAREKLIQTARQFSEKGGGQKYNVTVKRCEDLLADFLKLYQPLFDKIASHKEALQKDIMSQKETLTGVLGMIEVARGVEVLADRVRELETEAKTIETSTKERAKTLERIDDLLARAKHRGPVDVPKPSFEPSFTDASVQSDDFSLGLAESGRKSGAPRKATSRN